MTEESLLDRTDGYTYKVATRYGNLYITINEKDGKPCQVLIVLGKAGSFATAITEAVAGLISTSLQQDMTMDEIINQFRSELFLSILNDVVQVLDRYQKERLEIILA